MRQFIKGQSLTTRIEDDSPGQRRNRSFHAPERTFERTTGCYNCLHFHDGELAAQHYASLRNRDRLVLLGRGLPAQKADEILAKQDGVIAPPKSGICLKGDAAADLVSQAYMCHRWSGRIKPDGGISETPQELRNRVDGDVDKED